MSKKTWIILAVIIIAFGGLIWFLASKKTGIDLSGINIDTVIPANELNGEIGDQFQGNADAKLVVIEYGDYLCAGCASISPRINALAEEYKDHVAFVFRNLPLITIHPNSKAAVAASLAAELQGKYWEMHDLIYKNQSAWGTASIDDRTSVFASYAEQLNLNKEQFLSDLNNPKILQRINFDIAITKAKDVSATPTFYLNSELIDSSVWGTDEKFREFLNQKLKDLDIDPPASAE